MIDNFHYPDGSPTPLSNFFPSPFDDTSGVIWPTVEHYFQAMKSADLEGVQKILHAPTPGIAKKYGRQVTLRADWEAVKYQVMRDALSFKFPMPRTQPVRYVDPLTQWLLDTGDQMLIEGNTWGDRIWGQVNGVGLNWLGTLLMARRAELRAT